MGALKVAKGPNMQTDFNTRLFLILDTPALIPIFEVTGQKSDCVSMFFLNFAKCDLIRKFEKVRDTQVSNCESFEFRKINEPRRQAWR